jgi:hypothetical protein
MLGLSILSLAAIGRMQVDAGHLECAALYTVTAMRPGTRKSAVFSQMLAPVVAHERGSRERQRVELGKRASELRIKRGELEHLESKAAKARGALSKAEVSRMRELQDVLSAGPEPGPFRLLADDATPEQLATILSASGGSLGVFSAEGGGLFEIMGGRYSPNRAPNFEVFLRGHVGEPLRIDRRGRAEDIPRAVLAIGLATQPWTLERLASHPSQRARGLCGRFLYALPPDNLGTRKVRAAPVSESIATEYHARVSQLLEGTEHPRPSASLVTLVLDEPARKVLDEYAEELEPKLATYGELGHMTDWAAKLVGTVARVAAMLHLADLGSIEQAAQRAIGAHPVRRAEVIGDYLTAHARAAFAAMDADPELAAARKLLDWVRHKQLAQFTKRDAFEGLKGWVGKASLLDDPLSCLERHGWIRRAPVERPEGRRGRDPSPLFEACPALWNDSQNSPEHPEVAHSANSANSARLVGASPEGVRHGAR